MAVTAELPEQCLGVPQHQVGLIRPRQVGVGGEQRPPLGPERGTLRGLACQPGRLGHLVARDQLAEGRLPYSVTSNASAWPIFFAASLP